MPTEKLQKIYQYLDTMNRIFDDPSVYTRKLSDHYIPLITNAINPETGERTQIQIRDFFKPRGDQPAAKKIIVVGDSGEGKTTMIHQMLPNAWGNRLLFNEFTHIFKLKLKLLTSNNWQGSYAGLIQDEPLSCFIHYSSNQGVEKKDRITYQEVKEILANEDFRKTTLLLLDGFDEIAHLLHNSQIKEILDEALDFEYLIMTSRPNALSTLMENEFDLKTEVIGFDEIGASVNMRQYFSKQGEALLEKVAHFLDSPHSASASLNDALFNRFKTSRDPLDQEALIQLKRIAGAEKFLGATKEAILRKIEDYYTLTQQALTALLENSEIQELALNPMNAEMLCLVCSDPEVRDRFAQDFTITELYKEVIILMGKRFISKSIGDVPNKTRFIDITDKDVLESKELILLKEIAYEAFKNGNLIHGSSINRILETALESARINIRDLYDFGLLKVVTHSHIEQNDDLLHQEHTFVHLSFQEYLTATLLTEKLMSDNIAIAHEAAQFIAAHRNEPKFLTLFKFVANMVTKLPDEHAIAITRFWEAVECNIDGVLELGIDRKITLFMHLLSQAKKAGQLDPRIPNLEQVKLLIDETIGIDLSQWKETIHQSGYLSEAIEISLWHILMEYQQTSPSSNISSIPSPIRIQTLEVHNSLAEPTSTSTLSRLGSLSESFVDVKMMVELASGMLNKIDNARLFEILLNNLRLDCYWQITQASIATISKIVSGNKIKLTATQTFSLTNKLVALLENDTLHKPIEKLLEKLIDGNSDSNEKLITIMDNLISLVANKIKIPALAHLIGKIAANNRELLGLTLDKLVPLLNKEDGLDLIIPTSATSSSGRIKHSIIDTQLRNDVIQVIEELIHNIPETASLAIERLTPLLDNDITRENSAFTIWKILVVSDIKIQESAFAQVMSNLHDEALQAGAILAINAALRTNTQISDNFANNLLNMLNQYLDNNTNKDIIIEAIIKIATISGAIEIDTQRTIIDKLITRINTDNPTIYMAISKVARNGGEAILKEVLDFFFSKLDSNPEVLQDLEAPINELTSHEIAEEHANRILIKLLPLLREGNEKVILSIANIIAQGYASTTEKIEIANIFSDLILQRPSHKITEAILTGSKNDEMRQLLRHDLIELLDRDITTQNTHITKLYVVKLISHMNDGMEAEMAYQLYPRLIAMLSNQELDEIILSEAIGNLAVVDPDRTAPMILTSLISIVTDHTNKQVISMALHSIAKIIEKQAPNDVHVHDLLLEGAIGQLNDVETRFNAVYLMHKIFSTGIYEKPLPQDVIKTLMSLLRDKTDIIKYAAPVINIILTKTPLNDIELEPLLKRLLKLEDLNHELQSDINIVITTITKSMSLPSIIPLLQHKNIIMRQIATEVLLDKLVSEGLDAPWEAQVSNILEILSKSLDFTDLNYKKLYETARKTLQIQVKSMDSDDINLNWINLNFRTLLDNYKTEASLMMKAIFYNALKDGAITEIESRFISLCIEVLKFTITIRSPQQEADSEVKFALEFEGHTLYFVGEANRKYIEQIANQALKNTLNPLAAQYSSYIPVFTNTGSGISISATDVLGCKSLLDMQNLRKDATHFSFVYLSDSKKELPTNAFILMEQRIFGHYVAYKIFIDPISGKLDISEYKRHPNELDPEFRMKIFGKMEYEQTKLRYYAKSFDILLSEEDDLIKSAIDDIPQTSTLSQRHSSNSGFSLASIVNMRHFASPRHHHDNSFDPEKIIKRLYDFANQHIYLQEHDITGVWRDDLDHFTMIGRKDLILVDRNDSGKIDLISLVAKDNLKEKAKREVEQIETDPYKEAFYLEIIGQLNSVYIASSSIHSDMVANQSKGTIGNIGSLLDTIAPNIPFGGAAIASLIGSILNELDAAQQVEKVENYFHFARDSVVMAEIAEKIARKLTLLELEISEEPTDLFSTAIDSASSLLDAGVAGNIVALGRAAVEAFSEEKESENPQRDAQVDRGKHEGAIIASEIIKKIFAGQYSKTAHISLNMHPNRHKAHMVIRDISSLHGKTVIETDLPHHSTAEDDVDASPEEVILNLPASRFKSPTVKTTTKADPAKDVVTPGSGGCNCIIMNAKVEYEFENDPLYQEKLISAPSKEIALQEYFNEKFPECIVSKFILTIQGVELLNKAASLYGQEASDLMLELGKDKEIAEQILESIAEQGIEKTLDVFFGVDLMQSIENFDKIIATEDSDHSGFNQYINAAFRNNNFAKQVITKINSLYTQIEKWLTQEMPADQIAIQLTLLQDLLSYTASGMPMNAGFRPPAPGPGNDHGSGGGSGGSSSSGGRDGDNNTYATHREMLFNFVINLDNLTLTGEDSSY